MSTWLEWAFPEHPDSIISRNAYTDSTPITPATQLNLVCWRLEWKNFQNASQLHAVEGIQIEHFSPFLDINSNERWRLIEHYLAWCAIGRNLTTHSKHESFPSLRACQADSATFFSYHLHLGHQRNVIAQWTQELVLEKLNTRSSW